ncbi:benzoate transport protein-like [Bolinopsis microptera]|uniref:benzoate transport protein-like n=1 Tax=Bolinopsis microptera TaxID=2820187 RepID=UPI00307A4AD6
MADSEDLQIQPGEISYKEETPLIEQQQSWTRMDKLLLVFSIVMNLGDGVEMYLPGVIAQQVSCDIELSPLLEGILQCIQYFTLAVATVTSGLLADRFGTRELTLFSLYLSVISTVVCAVVADYATLLLSRALIGFCVGLNLWIHNVIVTELASSKEVLSNISLIGSTMYTFGGVWVPVLGSILLDVVEWRVFILLTSLPFFLPPIFMLHFCLADTAGSQMQDKQNEATQVETVAVPNLVTRLTKLCFYRAVLMFQGWLTILLVPAMIQLINIRKAGLKSDCHETATQGTELFILALVTFAAIPGKLFGGFLQKRVSFRKSQVAVGILNVGIFAAMLIQENLVVVAVTNFIVKFLYGISSMATYYILIDKEFFGETKYASASGIAYGMGLAGGVAGTATVAFAPTLHVTITALVLSALQILLAISMTEVEKRITS